MQNMGLEHTRVFPLIVLKDITDNFSEERVIGRGGSGVVYKGILDNGEVIAVKKLHRDRYDSCGKKLGNCEAQFHNEVMNLLGIQHPNIIRLLGYCYEVQNTVTEYDGKRVFASEEERVLCLEYMQGGSLKDHISDESCGLEWHTRYNIIRGVCEGLKYLHTGSENPIYHLDLKPENIWLDRDMVPKIGDFGISRLPSGSLQTYATENAVSGTIGYMAPEYIGWNQISQKCDVYSLGFIMIRIIAGEMALQNYDPHRPSEGFIESVHKNWSKRLKATMSSHSLLQVKTCIEIALSCVEFEREKRPTVTDIVDKLNKVDAAKSSAIGGAQNTKEEEQTTLENQPDIQEQNENNTEHLEGKMKDQVNTSMKKNLQTLVTMDLPKAVGVNSAIVSSRPRCTRSQEQDLHDEVLHLQSDLLRLKDTLPSVYNLIDGAEWKSHEHLVAALLPKLKDAVDDADDLLDEFRWHEMNVKLEGNESKSPFIDFFDTVIQGRFNKLTDVQGRLDHISRQLEKMELRIVSQRFDKTVRPETSSLQNEAIIFGRDKALKEVMGLLGVSSNSKRKRAISSRITSLPVLPIVGIGGLGKTTLAQHVCSNEHVKLHFELVIWICVSDDFDVKRLTKEVIQSCPKNKATPDNLDSLQRALSNHLNNKRLLLVLDDMWDDALKENGQCWRRFCAPLLSAQEGSMILVTTRCPKVAEGVRTMESVILQGLNDDVFWEFFKLCAFGSENSDNDPELESIGRNILAKLKGSPLAAKTLGRMLKMDLQASHWNCILESELWKLPQEATDILPALRLSYMYLPFYLKRCFSFCAVYPKDYVFQKDELTEIWVAEGFVESKHIGFQYFQDLVARSFFQEARGGYVIHDLLHDMAQKVSEHDCFILRNTDDFDKVPLNVRHINILPNCDILMSDLLRLCKHTKLRTLFCKKKLLRLKTSSVMDQWCTKLPCIRVISCASTDELPQSIGNLKHLRYLKISRGCPWRIPSAFCQLYYLQILDVKTCKIESLPNDFSNLRSLQRFVSEAFSYCPVSISRIDSADEQAQGVRLMKNLNQFRGHLEITNVGMLSQGHAAEAELKNKQFLDRLSLDWYPDFYTSQDPQIMRQDAIEVFQVLQPPDSLKSLILERYPGVSFPRWFQSQNINLNEIPDVLGSSNDSIGIFLSLTDLTITRCQNLSSLENFVHPDYIPAIKKITLHDCKNLLSVSTERFGDFRFLEELDVADCPNISSQTLVSPFLKRLHLGDCGCLLLNIECLSVTKFVVSTDSVTSIQPQTWSLPALEELIFCGCKYLTSIGVSTNLSLCEGNGRMRAFSKLRFLNIEKCPKLSFVNGIFTQEYLPAIERIDVSWCKELLYLSGEMFGDLSSLKHLWVSSCPLLNWHSGLALPSSLCSLMLVNCGDFSASVTRCLENLTSLVSLRMAGCQGTTSIPGSIWRNLTLLEELNIWNCPNLVSVGGAMAVSKIKEVIISECSNLEEAEQIMRKGKRSSRRN